MFFLSLFIIFCKYTKKLRNYLYLCRKMWFYLFILRIAALFNKKAKLLIRGERQTLASISEKVSEKGTGYVWFHAASVGEFEQIRPVIELFRLRQPDKKVLLTFFSPSGYELRKDYDGADIVAYLPFATRRRVRRFLDMVQPELAVFVKYEFWPAYLKELKKRAIPTYSVASIFRKNQAFFKPVVGWWYRRLLKCFTQVLVQDKQSELLLHQYGITNTAIVGDPRFNRVLQVAKRDADQPLVGKFANLRQVLVAGSTWMPDEKLLYRYWKENPDLYLILAPHEIDEKHLHFLFNMFEGRILRYTELTEQNISSCRVLLVDTIGVLSQLYRYGQVAYIGGGFGVGIHNTLEAAAYGIPVCFGPNYHHFREAEGLIEAQAAIPIKNYKTLKTALDTCFSEQAMMGGSAKNFVLSEQDSAERIYSILTDDINY